jgi:hypothetical protein
MAQLIPIQVDADTIIYVEPATDIQVQPPPAPTRELTRDDLDLGDKGAIEDATRKAMQSFAAMETTIKTYTRRTLNAFRELAVPGVDKVQLEFGINLGGEAGGALRHQRHRPMQPQNYRAMLVLPANTCVRLMKIREIRRQFG